MELLSPAKDLETLVCAFDAGADAVYAGLTKFSARARAKNLTIEELYKASEIKKRINKKLYIALNTLIFEPEIPELLEILLHLRSANIDGLIIQDYGIYQIVRELNLPIPLHASTQMGTKNHFQARFLEELGFKRVILERQLSLDEIRSIREKTQIEIELFIHGAMCFSLSGYCFFSRILGTRSGNRGDCAQPCRWSYIKGDKDHTRPLYMKDLSALTLLPQLKKIGVNSLKIEGRLKGVEYIYNVVRIYKEALELMEKKDNSTPLYELERELENLAFTRKTTKGFFLYQQKGEDFITNDCDSVGQFVGEISSTYAKSIYFKTKVDIKVGDTLRLVDKQDRAFKAPVKAIYKDNKKVSSAKSGDFIGIPFNEKGLSKSAKIYLVSRRFSYKKKLKIPIYANMPNIDEALRKLREDYKDRFFLESNSPKILKLTYHPERVYEVNGKRFFFIEPDIYESATYVYKKLSEVEKDLDGLFISHPCEVNIFNNKILYGSFYLYVTNKAALYFLKKLGISAFSISPDLNKESFRYIKDFSHLWFNWNNLPLWITRALNDRAIIRTMDNRKIKIDGKYGFLLK